MVWILCIVVVVAAVLVFISRPTHMIRNLMRLAAISRAQMDWTKAANFYREASQNTNRLEEPRKSKTLALIEISWASVLHRLGRMEEADNLFRQGFAKADVQSR